MKAGYHHGDLRAALIERGLQMLAERSVDALSLRELAREVGVSATAVYRHFPDKGALMAALAWAGLERLAAAQRRAAEAAGGGEAGFDATGRAYVRFALENPALFRLIFASPGPPDLLQAPAGRSGEAMAFLKANVAGLLPAGATPPAVEAVAVQAWALVHGLAMLMLDGKLPRDEALVERVIGRPMEGERPSGRTLPV